MRWMLLLGLLGLAMGFAWPAAADEGQEARVVALAEENAKLRLALRQLSAASERSTTALARLGEQFVSIQAEYEKLKAEAAAMLQEVQIRDGRVEALRTDMDLRVKGIQREAKAARQRAVRLRELLELERGQTGYLRQQIRRERDERKRYYRTLLVAVGEPATRPLAQRLQDDPATHGTRIAPILAAMGKNARAALPTLDALANDDTWHDTPEGAAVRAARASIRRALTSSNGK